MLKIPQQLKIIRSLGIYENRIVMQHWMVKIYIITK